MKQVLSLFMISLTCLAMSATGCRNDPATEAGAPSPDAGASPDVLTGLENELWEAYRQKDGDAIARLVADNYLEVLSDRRNSKDHILRSYPEYEITNFELTDVNVISLGKHAGIVSYRLTITGPDAPAHPVYATSVWQQRGDAWVQVLYQESS